ncbi:hypothetical protein QSU92_14485 [Microbacterium sp. ET2]|uniref:hypothetical protein n=1 Tax=Microbacterium albipurpureum TaxID=3050384 RepID=UPI00259D1040|nr:hypothetical protein [Microbacterium sp. ET2 (Ac-2212)]WJL95140.1 hypothetical protein QSU92_14485 [Microbacterium sp. ET2 (Ac-2212)]
MRWDRFFDDLEDQLASEWEAERAALDTEAERLRVSRLEMRQRLTVLQAEASHSEVSWELSDGSSLNAGLVGVGADWVALSDAARRTGITLVPLPAIVGIRMSQADLLRTARADGATLSGLASRMTFGFVVRDLVRRRAAVALQLSSGRGMTGTIDRAGADHLDIALHDPGSPRRTGEVTGYRMVPFSALAWLRAEEGVSVL